MDDEDLRDHIVVFGFGGVARRIVKQLARTGRHIVVVEAQASPSERETLRRYGVQYHDGFGQSEETLQACNVAQAAAAVCVTGDDLRNIEIGLLVRERSDDIRIVVQMANAAVGRALTSVAKPGAVLEVAQLASRSFVEAAIRRTTHSITLGGERFVIATFPSQASGTLRSIWGDRAPIAVRPADGSATETCPSRDFEVSRGDLITLLGTDEDYREAGLRPTFDQATAPRRGMGSRIREALAAASDAVDRPFKFAFAVLAALSALSVVILTVGYVEPDGTRMSVLDAVYFTAETIATVGFGDFYFRDQSDWLRVWAVLIVLLGATLVAVSTAFLTNALVSRRLEQSLGRQRLTGMRDHIVVIGLGSVGSHVAQDLRDGGYDVAVIDGGEGQRFIPQMRAAGIPVLIGDATLAETLTDAGVSRAAGVAVLTTDDLVNIETALAVRGSVTDPDVPIVLRVFGRNLARVVGENLEAGVTRSIAELAAPWFVGAALGLDVLSTFYVGETPLMAARIVVRDGSGFDGVSVHDLGAATRVVAIERASGGGGLEHPLQRDTRFRAGDSAYLVGQYEDLVDLLRSA